MPRDGPRAVLDDKVRVRHMLDAAVQARSFASGRERGDLDRDQMLLVAVAYCIQSIGEAASKASEAGRARVPLIPWKPIVGMRHVIVHVYFNIRADAIREVVSIDLPVLVPAFEAALRDWDAAAPSAHSS